MEPIALIILAALYIILIAATIINNKRRKSELSEQLKDLTLNVNKTAKTTLINSPFPLIIIEANGNIIWRSEKFNNEFKDLNKDNLELMALLSNIKQIAVSKKNSMEKKQKGKIEIEFDINRRTYKILGTYIKTNKDENNDYTFILYFIDQTEIKKLQEKEEETEINIGMISIDNYDEINQRLSGEIKSQVIAKIEQCIYEWALSYSALVVKVERDKFYVVIDNKNLENAKKDKINILQQIKELPILDGIQATLSISFSKDGETLDEKYRSAQAVQEIALGRGGDQAIIKQNQKYEFFGGRTEEVEKRTKVKARTVASALVKLIEESDRVLIMGHTNSDMDAIGSALGIYRLTKTLNKEANIIVDSKAVGILSFLETIENDKEYIGCVINGETALEKMTDNTLLVIVDTNKVNYVESVKVLENASKIVEIDHHRKSTDYIKDTVLSFHEVYASSASELVTEIIQYSPIKIKLTPIEIEALYAGIMLDTKEFTFKTGVRTFEAAAYLRKCGVDIIKVKKWFQDDLKTYQTISNIISKAEIVKESIAISTYDEDELNTTIVIAKAADELLTISGISASFVLGKTDDIIYISGRSIGDINVQLILEKLGGGGHITLAGAQLYDITMEEALEKLKHAIDEYMIEN
ncbi:MAG: DHH family phosphoesterase [Clostridiales bacterium]|nr:DHH family phosphoesterase [Clostridiales bacterium]